MRIWIGTCASLFAVGLFVAAGCSDDTSAGGDGGGDTTTTTSSGTGGGGTGGGGTGGTGAGGSGACTEISADDFAYLGGFFNFVYGGLTNPTLGGADEDWAYLQLYDPELTGTVDLGTGDNANFSTCLACMLVLEDAPEEGDPARVYFQKSGTLELGATVPYYIAGALTDVTLSEVTIDPDTGESVAVENGACLHIASIPFDIQPPEAGWTCDPLYYDAGDGCDCLCGVLDPDCNDPNQTDIFGCLEGQTCNASAECEGVPTAWTCDPGLWQDGTNCDCDCGAADPDCEDPNAPVLNCTGNDVCMEGKCLPDTWTCPPGYWEDGGFCDCDCGGVDPDCADTNLEVFGCSDPGESGVCLPDGTCEPA